MELRFTGAHLLDVCSQMRAFLESVGNPHPSLGPFPPGYGVHALSLGGLGAANEARWEEARQLGFRQGFERGLAEGKAGDVANVPVPEFAEVCEQRPNGCNDYLPDAKAEALQQALNVERKKW